MHSAKRIASGDSSMHKNELKGSLYLKSYFVFDDSNFHFLGLGDN